MNKYQAYRQREQDREELISKLQQQNRESDRNMREFDGWADKLMAKILSPLSEDAKDFLHIKKIPHKGQL